MKNLNERGYFESACEFRKRMIEKNMQCNRVASFRKAVNSTIKENKMPEKSNLSKKFKLKKGEFYLESFAHFVNNTD